MGASRGRVWTGVVRVSPGDKNPWVALRVAISLGGPLLVLFFVGRLDLALYSSFGAFTALYGRYDGVADRLRMQLSAAGILLASMLIGTTLSFAKVPEPLIAASVALLAALVTQIAYTMRWHPPGSLFAVFAAGATGSIPATAGTFAMVLLVGGGTAIFSLLVSALVVLGRRSRFVAPPPPADVGRVAWEMSLTVLIGAVLAGGVGLLIGSHWYWATVSAVAAVAGAHVTARVIRGLQRLAGTLLGIAVAAGVLALHFPPLVIILLAVCLQACAELMISRNYGLAMVFVTPLALMMVHLVAPIPVDQLLRDRALETVIGVTAGTIVAVASAAIRGRRANARPAS